MIGRTRLSYRGGGCEGTGIAASLVFRERLRRRELVGDALLAVALVVVTLRR
jgi:drug/metabolite transporter (DMT)-like permease